jgi:hypothetical protein
MSSEQRDDQDDENSNRDAAEEIPVSKLCIGESGHSSARDCDNRQRS